MHHTENKAEAIGLEPTTQLMPSNRLAICCSTNYAYASECPICIRSSLYKPGLPSLVRDALIVRVLDPPMLALLGGEP